MLTNSAVLNLRAIFGSWNKTEHHIRRKRVLILLLIALHILPMWTFKYFPSQDGPAHLSNSYVLKALQADESTLLREYYKLNLTLFPNWLSHAIMSVLMRVVPPLAAGKILLSLIIALFPLSLFYFLDAVHSRQNWTNQILGPAAMILNSPTTWQSPADRL